MKKLLVALLAVTSSCFALTAGDIVGFWKTINEEGVAQSIIAVYPYNGLYYGRLIASFSDTEPGKIDDSIYHPTKRAPGVEGQLYYCGLDIIWDMKFAGSKYKGKILDPQKGHIYNAEMWEENDILTVRGKYLIFGRNQNWLPVKDSDLPKDFVLPDVSTFVPVIPTPKSEK